MNDSEKTIFFLRESSCCSYDRLAVEALEHPFSFIFFVYQDAFLVKRTCVFLSPRLRLHLLSITVIVCFVAYPLQTIASKCRRTVV